MPPALENLLKIGQLVEHDTDAAQVGRMLEAIRQDIVDGRSNAVSAETRFEAAYRAIILAQSNVAKCQKNTGGSMVNLEFWSNHGLDYRMVCDFLDLNAEDLSKIGGISKRSVRLDSGLPDDLKVRLECIADICGLVSGSFDCDIHKTGLWFRTPNPMLGDISRHDMIRFGRCKRLLRFVMEARDANRPNAGAKRMLAYNPEDDHRGEPCLFL